MVTKPKRPKPANGDAHGIADPFPDRSGQPVPTAGDPAFRLQQGPKKVLPVLTLFATSSAHVLRLEDTSYTSLALAVAREIRSGSLIVVTPTDTKVFDLGSMDTTQPTRSSGDQTPVPPPSEDIIEQADYVQGEGEEEELPPNVEPEFQEGRVRHREHTPAAPNSVCGRCNGSGVTMAGGGCPVCGGKGTIIAWGRGRSQ